MHGDKSDLQVATEICNDLSRLIPIGSLFFYGVPASGFSLANTSVGHSKWFWLDAHFLSSVYGALLHPSLKALVYLVNCRFLSAVYKASFFKSLTVWKIRVYAVPSDIQGSRFLRSWRNRRFRNATTLARNIKTNMLLLLSYLDFSCQTWRADFFPSAGGSGKLVLVPFTSAHNTEIPSNLHMHMKRWVNSSSSFTETAPILNLDQVLQSVYNRIETPDLSAFTRCSISNDPSSPESIIRDLLDEKRPSILYNCGLITELYHFQLESLCKMYEKESFTSRDHVPNFVKLSSPIGHTYYYDTITGEIFKEAELMANPRGGILAENMGLGKTLVCLALVCLTKHEHSCIPDNLLLYENNSNKRTIPRSLFEMAKTTVLQTVFWKQYEQHLPPNIVEDLANSPATFSVYEDTQPERSRAGRQTKTRVRTLHLCSTTLVVVPENIIHQWIGEMEKHLHDESLKKLYIFSKNNTQLESKYSVFRNSLPTDIPHLLSYDLILLSSNHFSKLSADPDNILMSVYWKRLIIDEGHSLNSRASNLSILCKSLYAERRWAVSGTPTSGLTNLQMEDDDFSKQEILGSDESHPRKKRKYVVKSKFNSKEDLRKLGNLVTSYFQVEPFASQPSLWNKTIVKDLVSSNQFAASYSLQKILNNLMVRHSQPQVEKDINLPSLHHEAVFLEPSYHNKLAINLFTSVLAVNAVTSERVGSDYMFDASNRKQLRALVTNLQLSTFYWTGFKVGDVRSLLNVATEYLNKKKEKKDSLLEDRDRVILQESIQVAEIALNNPRWRIAASIHEMQYLVKNLPQQFSYSYAIEALGENGIYGGPQLVAVQRFFFKNRFKDTAGMTDLLCQDSRQFWKHYWQDFEKKHSEKLSKKAKAVESAKLSASDKEQGEHIILEDFKTKKTMQNSNLASAQPTDLRKSQIVSTASAKLSYLICKLFDGQANGTKSIVFFDFEDHAYFLTEALDILGMGYLLYATFIGSKTRAENLEAFSSREAGPNRGICLIMDIKLASHGLNIIAATKVYFINPVWQRSIEAQAIKRAHRIGQTKEVYVETLILKGTLEEEIYRKRQDGTSDSLNVDSSNKHVIDDVGIQSFVLKHNFLPFERTDGGDGGDEYCPFAMQEDQGSSVPPESDDGFALPSHSKESIVVGTSIYTQWKMHLFTPESLQKISEIDAKRHSSN